MKKSTLLPTFVYWKKYNEPIQFIFLKPEGDSYVPISNQLVSLIAKVTQNTKDKQKKPCIPISETSSLNAAIKFHNLDDLAAHDNRIWPIIYRIWLDQKHVYQ